AWRDATSGLIEISRSRRACKSVRTDGLGLLSHSAGGAIPTVAGSDQNVTLNSPFVTVVNGGTVAMKEKVPLAPVAVRVARVTVPLTPSSPPPAAGIHTPASSASDEYVPTTAGTVTITST